MKKNKNYISITFCLLVLITFYTSLNIQISAQKSKLPASILVIGDGIIDQGEPLDVNITLTGENTVPIAGELTISERTGVFGTDYSQKITPLGIGRWNLYISGQLTLKRPDNYTLIINAVPDNSSYLATVLNYTVTILSIDEISPDVDFSVETVSPPSANITGDVFLLHADVSENYGLRYISIYTDTGYNPYIYSISETTNVTGDITITYTEVNLTKSIRIGDNSRIIYFEVSDVGFNKVIKQFDIPLPIDQDAPVFENFDTSDLDLKYRPGEDFTFIWQLSDTSPLETLTVKIEFDDVTYGIFRGNESGAILALPEHPEGSKKLGWTYRVVVNDYFGHISMKYGIIQELVDSNSLTNVTPTSSSTTTSSKTFLESSIAIYVIIVMSYTMSYYRKKFQRIKKENSGKRR